MLTLNTNMDVILGLCITNVVGERIWVEEMSLVEFTRIKLNGDTFRCCHATFPSSRRGSSATRMSSIPSRPGTPRTGGEASGDASQRQQQWGGGESGGEGGGGRGKGGWGVFVLDSPLTLRFSMDINYGLAGVFWERVFCRCSWMWFSLIEEVTDVVGCGLGCGWKGGWRWELSEGG